MEESAILKAKIVMFLQLPQQYISTFKMQSRNDNFAGKDSAGWDN